jgi:DNA-binding NtrC family response regulator
MSSDHPLAPGWSIRRLLSARTVLDEPSIMLDPAQRGFSIGRARGTVSLLIDDPLVSRLQATLRRASPDHWRLVDEKSRNGTLVEGHRIVEPTDLGDGATFVVGSTLLMLSADEDVPDTEPAAGLIGRSLPAKLLLRQLRLFARQEGAVLISGPTGSGKERCARAVHDESPRCSGPYVALNAAALMKSIAESELFGHVRGAFTGAGERRPGRILEAHRGTIFIDEVGELDLEVQAKLLRVLEDRVVVPVGGSQADARVVDFRLVTATNRDLAEEVRAGRFRRDLYARINQLPVCVPPLSARRGDVLAIFASVAGPSPPQLSLGLATALIRHDWPENVRELRAFAARVRALGPSPYRRDTEFIGEFMARVAANIEPATERAQTESASAKRQRFNEVPNTPADLVAILKKHSGNLVRIQQIERYNRSTFYRQCRKLGVSIERFRSAE